MAVGEQQRPVQYRDSFCQIVKEMGDRHPDGMQVELGNIACAKIKRYQPERPEQGFTLLLTADPLVVVCKVGIQNRFPSSCSGEYCPLTPTLSHRERELDRCYGQGHEANL